VGDQPIIQREMEGSDDGEVKDTVLLLAKQMVELKKSMNLRKKLLQDALNIHWEVFQAQRSSLELEES